MLQWRLAPCATQYHVTIRHLGRKPTAGRGFDFAPLLGGTLDQRWTLASPRFYVVRAKPSLTPPLPS